MQTIIKNKKAQAGELLQDTVGLVIIALLLIIFLVISSSLWGFPKKELETLATEHSIHNQEHLSLQAWLQKSIEIEIDGENQKITMADLIRLSKINPYYKEILDQEASYAFDIYNYEFETSNKKEIEMGSSFYIPSNETIKVNLEIKK